MNGAILGLDTRQMEKRFDAIAAFAEIGDFMDQPVKTYSSGMFMRLAFAVAVNVDPDILLVDEALSVGDLIFQHRCMHRMNHLRDSGKTIVLVTHDLDAVTKFCDLALLLDGGRLLEQGKPDMVVQKYRALIFERERRYGGYDGAGESSEGTALVRSKSEMPVARSIPNIDHRFGNGEAVLLGVELLDERGAAISEAAGGQKANHSRIRSIQAGYRPTDHRVYAAGSAGSRIVRLQYILTQDKRCRRSERSDHHQRFSHHFALIWRPAATRFRPRSQKEAFCITICATGSIMPWFLLWSQT